MKLRSILAGLLISAATSAAQTLQPGDQRTGSVRYPPGGRVAVEVHLSESVGSLDQLIRMSHLIVDGTVISVLPSIDRNPNVPDSFETHSLVSITEVLLRLDRGADGLTRLSQTLPAGGNIILLAQEGGKVGEREVVVPDDPLVKQGERYILFLGSDNRKQPPNTFGSPRYYTVGAWSGKPKVENGKIHVLPRALLALREHHDTDVGAFTATVRQRISVLVPKEQYIVTPRQLGGH